LLLPLPIISAFGQFVVAEVCLSNMCECVNSFIFTYAGRFPIVFASFSNGNTSHFSPFAVRQVCLSS